MTSRPGSLAASIIAAVALANVPASAAVPIPISVTSNAAMYFFYERTGRRGTKSSFETTAAVEAGHAVRSEVRRPVLVAQNQ